MKSKTHLMSVSNLISSSELNEKKQNSKKEEVGKPTPQTPFLKNPSTFQSKN